MQQSGLGFADLDRLAVSIGPGTFTGQRVGYAFMRAMRLALRRPLIGVTTLSAMAKAARAETGANAAAVLHDCRRGEIYACAEMDGTIILPVQLTKLDDALRAIHQLTEPPSGVWAFAGTAAGLAAQSFREWGHTVKETNIHSPDALWVARLALDEPEPLCVPPPLYLRPPDARLPA